MWITNNLCLYNFAYISNEFFFHCCWYLLFKNVTAIFLFSAQSKQTTSFIHFLIRLLTGLHNNLNKKNNVLHASGYYLCYLYFLLNTSKIIFKRAKEILHNDILILSKKSENSFDVVGLDAIDTIRMSRARFWAIWH